MIRWSCAIFAFLALQSARAETLRTVRIDFVEALAPRDTTSSIRFEKDYRSAIQTGADQLKSKLARCGYALDTKIAFYEANDALMAKELASKSENEGSWLIVGPRRSNHYLLLTQGAPDIPTISLMASADDVAKLGKRHVSLSPTNSEMARMAVREAVRKLGTHATYITVVSDDCSNCVDFSKAFDKEAARAGLQKLDELPVRGESFDPQPIVANIRAKNPRFVLLPNYSIVSGVVMDGFKNAPKSPLFIGGDGWGDNRYGFIQAGRDLRAAQGLTVRGLPPVENGLGRFPLGQRLLISGAAPAFAPSMGILQVLDSVSDTLCSARPRSKADFSALFDELSARRFRAPWGVSVFELKSGEISYARSQAVR